MAKPVFCLWQDFFKLLVKIAMAQMENYWANNWLFHFVVIILLSFVFENSGFF